MAIKMLYTQQYDNLAHACVLAFAKRFGEARPEYRTTAYRHVTTKKININI
jgi:hypothetical protein